MRKTDNNQTYFNWINKLVLLFSRLSLKRNLICSRWTKEEARNPQKCCKVLLVLARNLHCNKKSLWKGNVWLLDLPKYSLNKNNLILINSDNCRMLKSHFQLSLVTSLTNMNMNISEFHYLFTIFSIFYPLDEDINFHLIKGDFKCLHCNHLWLLIWAEQVWAQGKLILQWTLEHLAILGISHFIREIYIDKFWIIKTGCSNFS